MRIISPFSFETGTSKDSAEGKMSAFTERLLYCGARGSVCVYRTAIILWSERKRDEVAACPTG